MLTFRFPKAQVSTEFIALLSFLILVFFGIVLSSYYFQGDVIKNRIFLEFEKLAESIAFEINLAFKAGNGYARKFWVRESVFGIRDFEIEIGNYSVKIKWKNYIFSALVGVKEIEGKVKKGSNLILNKDGKIYVE